MIGTSQPRSLEHSYDVDDRFSLVQDRFNLHNDGRDAVLLWEVLKTLFDRPTRDNSAIIDNLDTIHEYLLRPYRSDFRFLKRFLADEEPNFATTT